MDLSALKDILFWGVLGWLVLATFYIRALHNRTGELRRSNGELNYRLEAMEQWRKSLRQ
mgnify:FL=1|jgi:hypothetical protein